MDFNPVIPHFDGHRSYSLDLEPEELDLPEIFAGYQALCPFCRTRTLFISKRKYHNKYVPTEWVHCTRCGYSDFLFTLQGNYKGEVTSSTDYFAERQKLFNRNFRTEGKFSGVNHQAGLSTCKYDIIRDGVLSGILGYAETFNAACNLIQTENRDMRGVTIEQGASKRGNETLTLPIESLPGMYLGFMLFPGDTWYIQRTKKKKKVPDYIILQWSVSGRVEKYADIKDVFTSYPEEYLKGYLEDTLVYIPIVRSDYTNFSW